MCFSIWVQKYRCATKTLFFWAQVGNQLNGKKKTPIKKCLKSWSKAADLLTVRTSNRVLHLTNDYLLYFSQTHRLPKDRRLSATKWETLQAPNISQTPTNTKERHKWESSCWNLHSYSKKKKKKKDNKHIIIVKFIDWDIFILRKSVHMEPYYCPT